MGTQWYIEAIFHDRAGDALLRTGVGAAGKDEAETRALFEAARRFGLGGDDPEGVFLLDLHSDDDSLLDTLCISRDAYTMITGHDVLTVEEYERTDREYYGVLDPAATGPCTFGMCMREGR